VIQQVQQRPAYSTSVTPEAGGALQASTGTAMGASDATQGASALGLATPVASVAAPPSPTGRWNLRDAVGSLGNGSGRGMPMVSEAGNSPMRDPARAQLVFDFYKAAVAPLRSVEALRAAGYDVDKQIREQEAVGGTQVHIGHPDRDSFDPNDFTRVWSPVISKKDGVWSMTGTMIKVPNSSFDFGAGSLHGAHPGTGGQAQLHIELDSPTAKGAFWSA